MIREGPKADNKIEIPGIETGDNGLAHTIWTYIEYKSEYDVIQMINFLGVDSPNWRNGR